MPQRKGQLARLAAALALAALCAACTRTTITDPIQTNYPSDDPIGELAFWHGLPGRSAVSNNEGLHGIILSADGADLCMSYERRVELAKSRGWLDAGFDEPADLAMQRGRLAQLVVGWCQIKGGVMMGIFGNTPRYATKELGALGMLPQGSSELQAITGLEYMSVITRAQDYLSVREARRAKDAASAPNPTPEPDKPSAPEPNAPSEPKM